MTTDEYAQMYNQFSFGGLGYGFGPGTVQQTLSGRTTEMAPNTFVGMASQAYAANGVVFACMMVRQLVFSSVRFRWQRMLDGKPSDSFGSRDLRLLERPWVGGTTQDMLSRMIQDADLAGNSYWTVADGEMVRLRPDWVDVIVEPRNIRGGRSEVGGGQVGWRKLGYLYWEGGRGVERDPVGFLADQVGHFAPIPDPLANFRGMSWLTPVLRELQADQAMTRHQRKFFDNGAPQPLDAKILTPSGWTTMGEIAVGDRVIGSDGKPKDVVAVYPQGMQDIYRVNFSSGTSTECTRDHLWSVASAYDRKVGVTRTMTLGEIVDGGITYKSGPAKWSVPLVSPVEYDATGEDLVVAPYVLGSLLGDGCMRANATGKSGTPSLACHVDDADEQVRLLTPLMPSGVKVSSRRRAGNCVELSISRIKGTARQNALTEAIRELGLFDCIGHQKSIPERYMRASVTDRIELLKGLLDTDGSVEKRQPNELRFTSTSERLAHQVAELASGLGGIGTVRASRSARDCHRAQWTARISRLPEWVKPFGLARKLDVYRPTLRGGAYRYIQSVELVGQKPAQCIAVDSDDHLYVTDDYILTHNTPNMIIKHALGADRESIQQWVAAMESKNVGVDNAYKTLNLYPGADATVVGSNLKDIDFGDVRAGTEVRIAMAAGVPPVIVGMSKGLDASTYSNYSQARRRLADGTAHPLWENLAGSLEHLLPSMGDGVRLWYDADNVPFLREDEKDAADILQTKATTIASLITAGYEPDSVVRAVDSGDLRILKHSGLVSVQLLPPGTSTSATPDRPSDGGSDAQQ